MLQNAAFELAAYAVAYGAAYITAYGGRFRCLRDCLWEATNGDPQLLWELLTGLLTGGNFLKPSGGIFGNIPEASGTQVQVQQPTTPPTTPTTPTHHHHHQQQASGKLPELQQNGQEVNQSSAGQSVYFCLHE